ncbi:ABC transporter permease [Methylobacterium sp. E-045]|uniref:ABC transporter permease n=1 Tax=Methylobacterium sp. E-045 TaxID=2836575 RepID=UPI001FBA0A25|nr:ABC transporter permease subunit [Methylobacterium sp. E-045]MCJ2128174.1 ABC transporter permease subunit [Methylobacterium sp. E-045]
MTQSSLSRRVFLGTVSVLLVIGIWETAGRLSLVDALLLPPPSEILATTRELLQDGYRQTPLWAHLLLSLARALAGFGAAIVTGIPLGIAMGMSPVLSALIDPFVQFLRPLPKLALIPLVVLWFGIGETSKVLLIYLSTVLTIIVGAAAAVEQVRRLQLRAARALGARGFTMFRFVILPAILPDLFVTVRLAFGIGWTTLIAAEMIASEAGLGWMVVNAGAYLRTDVVMLGIVLLGATGYALDLALVGIQRWVTPWAGRG